VQHVFCCTLVHEVTVGEPPPGAAAAVMAAARTVKMVENCILKVGGWVALEKRKMLLLVGWGWDCEVGSAADAG
jgi:hypothetical protein